MDCYSDKTTADLTDALCQLEAAEAAVRRQKLAIVAEVDRREGWREDHAPSMRAWLTMHLRVSEKTARDYVRVARKLEECPVLGEASGAGALSWDQVVEVTRFVEPETDAQWTREAPDLSVRALRLHASRAETQTITDAREAHERRYLRIWWEQDTVFRLSGRLPADQGAAVLKALERYAEQAPRDLETGKPDALERRMADGLVALASQKISTDPDPDRATIVVHADADVLCGGDGRAHLEHAGGIVPETVRRLACDGRLQLVFDGRDGTPVGVGRMQRTVPPWVRRAVRQRDGGCRMCGRRFATHCHHVKPWHRGGTTDLDNLVELCPRCHWLVHEGGWRIHGDPNGRLRFIRPDGRALDPPPPIRTEVHTRIMNLLPEWLRSRPPPDTS